MQVEGRGVMCDLKAARALVHWFRDGGRSALGKLSAGDLMQKHEATL
jgi:hypothetical protein